MSEENADWEAKIHFTSSKEEEQEIHQVVTDNNMITCLNCKADFDSALDGFSDANLLLCGICKVEAQVQLKVPPAGIFNIQLFGLLYKIYNV
jgi:hypothetical protein